MWAGPSSPISWGLSHTCVLASSPSCRRQASNPRSLLVQQYILIRAIQRECGYLNVKQLAPIALHLVTSAHHPRRGVERRATRIGIALARLEEWLLPDN